MSLFTLLHLVSCAFAQSFVPAFDSGTRSNSCIKRSVMVYTSDSSTYFVTDVGTSSFPSTPTFCANVSVSTVTATQPPSTVTIYPQTTSAQESAGSQPSINPILTNNSFENGTASPFNSSSSVYSVTAEVVQSGVYEPHTGDSYLQVQLLITFPDPATVQRQVRRQSAGTITPLVYNVTQIFAASAGTSYTMTAWTAVITTENSKPDCSMTICGTGDCSLPFPLTTNYTGYSYNYQSSINEDSALATFQVACSSAAYVAMDDVSVTDNVLAASASSATAVSTATTTVFRTETVTQSQTLTQIETTTFISGIEVVLTTTVPTLIYTTIKNPTTEPRTVSTLLVSTATATTAVPEYVNVTVSRVSTTTTTLTTVINSTVISYQPSLVVQTEYATSTALFTTTQPGVTLPASTFYQDPSTAYITLDPSTIVVTLEQPVVTVTPDPVTLTSIPDAQTSMLVSYLSVTETVPVTLPQETAYVTPAPVTDYATLTLEPETITVYVSVTLPPLTETLDVFVTLPVETEIQTLTLPPNTETLQITETLPQVTETLPQITETLPQITETLPRVTETLPITQTLEVTQYGPTITATYSSVPEPSLTLVEEPSSTLVEEPSSTTEEPSYSSVYVPPPPSGVPAVALARPTAIVGDVNGSPVSVDDTAYPVRVKRRTLHCALLTGWLGTTTCQSYYLLGLGDLNYEYSNYQLPYGGSGSFSSYPACLQQTYTDESGNISNYCFGDVVAFGLWDDLFIYQGTQQGIYYEVDGAVGSRRISFEFYISHFSDQTQYYHFLMNFYENRPNVINYQYLNVSDHGISATVGVQSYSLQQYMQFSFNQPVVCPGMILAFDTTPGVNSYNVDNPGDCSIATTPSGNNGGEFGPLARTLKARPDYRGDTADYPGKHF
ncbi:hypothetical protein E4T43_01161 [Aureobasidium subglaciale]|nr:hypothetical protein E4T43_01161 [Aureobasidium subglaciale]